MKILKYIVDQGRFPFTEKFPKISIGNFRLGSKPFKEAEGGLAA